MIWFELKRFIRACPYGCAVRVHWIDDAGERGRGVVDSLNDAHELVTCIDGRQVHGADVYAIDYVTTPREATLRWPRSTGA